LKAGVQMSNLKIYSVRDIKVGSFEKPMFVKHEQEIIRSLTTVVNQKNSQVIISQYPEDFELHYLGEYDDSTGKFNLMANSQFILTTDSLRKVDTNDVQN